MAGLTLGAALQLECGVNDLKLVVQLVGDPREKSVLIAFAPALHQVRCERGLSRAHRPDVQYVDSYHARLLAEITAHRRGIDPFGHGIHSARFTESRSNPQVPIAMTKTINRLTSGSIQSSPVRMMARPAKTDAHRHARVRRHVQVGAPDVDVTFAAFHEKQSGGGIDDHADSRDPHDSAAGNRLRVRKTPDRLPRDRPDRDEQNDRVGQRGGADVLRRP